MSQTNTPLLDEVAQWSQETCRQKLKSYELSHKYNIPPGILKVITDMFLPHIDLSELEDECFSKIVPKVGTMFESMVKELVDQVGGLSSQNTELVALLRSILQAMVQIIDALSTCVRHIGTFEEVPDFYAIRSLPPCIMKVLSETFQHYKVVSCSRLGSHRLGLGLNHQPPD
uniref:Uncharacterized protein n=1 Tax=Cyclopterus lumpus TaxID=8103 RepID=A0A8C2ZNY7_CYCLU